jgi:hypothetical protein
VLARIVGGGRGEGRLFQSRRAGVLDYCENIGW